MKKKTHTTRLVCLLVGILFLPLAIYLLVSKQYVQLLFVIAAAALACNMLNRLFREKKVD